MTDRHARDLAYSLGIFLAMADDDEIHFEPDMPGSYSPPPPGSYRDPL